MGELITNPAGSKTKYTYVSDSGKQYPTENPSFKPSEEGYVFRPMTVSEFDELSPTEKTEAIETMEKGGLALGTYEKETAVISVGEGTAKKSMVVSPALAAKLAQDKEQIYSYENAAGETIYTTDVEKAAATTPSYFVRVPVTRKKTITEPYIETKTLKTGLDIDIAANYPRGEIPYPTRVVKREYQVDVPISRGGRPLYKDVEISQAQYEAITNPKQAPFNLGTFMEEATPKTTFGKALLVTSFVSPQALENAAAIVDLKAAITAGKVLQVTKLGKVSTAALEAVRATKTGTLIEKADEVLARTAVGRTLTGAAVKVGTYEAVKGGTIVASELTKPAEFRQIDTSTMNKALNQVYAAGSQSAQQKGAIQVFAYNINPAIADKASKAAGLQAGTEYLVSVGYKPELARAALERETTFRNIGTFIGDLSVSAISEVRGGRSVELAGLTKSSISSLAANKRAGFVLRKSFLPIALEGFTEGAAAEVGRQRFQEDQRALNQRLIDIGLAGGAGFASAGIIGSVVASAPYAKGKVNVFGLKPEKKIVGQIVEIGGYIVDPYEYSGDVIAKVAEKGNERLGRIRIPVQTNLPSLIGTQTKASLTKPKAEISVQQATNSFIDIMTRTNTQTQKTAVDLNIATNIGTPVDISTNINTETETQTNTFTDILTGTKTLTPLYRLPAPALLPLAPDFGGAGGGKRTGRTARRYVDELSAATSFFTAELGGRETSVLKPATRAGKRSQSAAKRANQSQASAAKRTNSLFKRLMG